MKWDISAEFERIQKLRKESRQKDGGSDISSDDVVLDTSNEINETLSQKRSMIFELLKAGVLSDEDGKINSSTKQHILEMIGFGTYEEAQNMTELQAKRAGKENLDIVSNLSVKILPVDDDKIHIKEHTAFLLSLDRDGIADYDRIASDLLSHIEEHKNKINEK